MGRLRHATGAVFALLGALLIGGILLVLTGHDPLAVVESFTQRVILRHSGIEESLVAMGPLLVAALAAWIAARVGLWNIGIDGQIVAGAVAAGALAPLMDDWPRVAMWVAVVVAGISAGALWALLPALLRVRSGINEIVTTIMMTYVAFSLASWLVKGPLKDEELVAPATVSIDMARRLPRLLETRVHFGVVVVLVLILAVAAVARWSAPGILSQVIGESPSAGWRLGIPVNRYVLLGFLLSGGVAALAGVTEVLATRGAVQGDWRPSMTLPAFAVLFLARKHVLALIPAALVLGTFAYASTVLPRATDLPPDFFPLLEGLLLILLAAEQWRYAGAVAETKEGRA